MLSTVQTISEFIMWKAGVLRSDIISDNIRLHHPNKHKTNMASGNRSESNRLHLETVQTILNVIMLRRTMLRSDNSSDNIRLHDPDRNCLDI